MNRKELKSQIQELATEERITFIEACKAMQSAAAQLEKEEKMIIAIHEIKMASIGL